MSVATTVYWLSAFVLVYVYFGYPVLLRVIKGVFGDRTVAIGEHEPPVTLVVSAFNEADVIAEKIHNSLALDYPREKLQILVVSDASDDGTDGIVEEIAEATLLRMEERGGKTLGLNAAIEAASGEIVVFSDANAMYQQDAIRKLIRNFADENVGAVVGESTYSESANDAERSESAYWRYETAIKALESELGSTVGGDGAIYAIRKSLYRPMRADALSDFVNPCQIIEQGYRCLYEREAISVEEAAGSFDKEYRRKVRIVNRAWRATMSMKHLMNPLQFGFFSLQLISHKLLRWLVPVFLVTVFTSNAFLLQDGGVYVVTYWLQIVFYLIAFVGKAMRSSRELPLWLYVPCYFCLVNAASAQGILEAYLGQTYTTWSTARAGG
ncbi:MAG: glycosyltransferase family 2 protein [Pseudomonadota bacterium]